MVVVVDGSGGGAPLHYLAAHFRCGASFRFLAAAILRVAVVVVSDVFIIHALGMRRPTTLPTMALWRLGMKLTLFKAAQG